MKKVNRSVNGDGGFCPDDRHISRIIAIFRYFSNRLLSHPPSCHRASCHLGIFGGPEVLTKAVEEALNWLEMTL